MPKCQHSEHCQPGCPCSPCHGSIPHISSQGHRSLAQQHHSPAWVWPCPGPWPPVAWLASLASRASSYSHSVVTGLSLTLVTLTGLTPLHVLSSASGQPQQHSTHGQGCPCLLQPALPLLLQWGWWEGPWLVTLCLPSNPSPNPHLTLARGQIWRRQSQALDRWVQS